MFRSLIHFEFIFVCGVRQWSSFILLQVVDQFSQHQMFKEIVFNPLYILASFFEDKVSIGVWIYLWAFYFVPLIYISVFLPVSFNVGLQEWTLFYGMREKHMFKEFISSLRHKSQQDPLWSTSQNTGNKGKNKQTGSN